jgi:hypothetical protein
MERVQDIKDRKSSGVVRAFPPDLIVRIAQVIGVSAPATTRVLRAQLRVLPSIIELYETRDLAGSATERILALGSVSRACAAVLKAFERDKREIASGLRRDVMRPQLIWSLAVALNAKRPEWAIRGGGAERRFA